MQLLELQNSPAEFRMALMIETEQNTRSFAECMDDWQRTDFDSLDNGWCKAVGQDTPEGTIQRAWLERPRGHSKSMDIATMALWALFASRKPLSGIAGAGDRDQALLLANKIRQVLHCNVWLSKIIEVQSYKIINKATGSTLEIISSDAPTSYGLTPDFIIADEIVHWKKRDLWDSLLSSAAKRSTCMFVVITNAGMVDDWQWTTRELIRNDPAWYFSRLESPAASWINQKQLAEQERLLPPIAFERLWLNQWTSGSGDALSRADIEFAFKQAMLPLSEKKAGWEYVAGLDLGVSRDSSAIVVLGIRRRKRWDAERSDHGEINLIHTQKWKPSKKQKVNLQNIEDAIKAIHKKFNLKLINADPWQATHMCQRLKLAGLPMNELPQTGTTLQKIATTLIEGFADRRIFLYSEPDLKTDLLRLRVEERSYGFRLVSPRDGTGHGDVASAFGYAMLAASEIAGKKSILLTFGNNEPQSELQKELSRLERQEARIRQHEEYLQTLGYDDQEPDWSTLRVVQHPLR